MMNTLLRTARSAILNTARDFSCCILTADDEMLAMAESLPIHVMSGPDLIARYMKDDCTPTLRQGDAFLHNSPYHGNSHAADWCVVIPVIDDDGVHRYTVLAKAHLADCGNAVPTTYFADATRRVPRGRADLPLREGARGLRDERRRASGWRASGSASPTSGTATSSRCSAPPGSASAACSS